MADAVTSQTLSDGGKTAVVKLTNISDGTGESSVAKVDVSALTNDIDLIPYIGIEAGAAAAEAVNVHYQAISRHVFE